MASDAEIVNNALLLLGDKPIASLADGTTRANLANGIYGPTRDSVLRAHPWNCAVVRASLPMLSTAPAFGWDYQYSLPSDPYCLRVLSLNNDQEDGDPGDMFKVEGRKLLTNQGTADILYIQRITDPNQYDSILYQALSARLAAAMAYPVTGSAAVMQQMWALYEGAMKEARSINGQEGSANRTVIRTLIDVR